MPLYILCTFQCFFSPLSGGTMRRNCETDVVSRKRRTCQEKLEPYTILFFFGMVITFMWSYYMIGSSKEISVTSGVTTGAFVILLTLLLASLGEAEG